MTVAEQLQRDGFTNDELLKRYIAAQKALFLVIERANANSPFRAYRIKQAREIDRILKELAKHTKGWAQGEIAKLVHAGADEVKDTIQSFDEGEFAMSFSGVSQSAVSVLTESAALEFGNTMLAMRRDATRAVMDKKKLNDRIVEGIIQGSSVARTQNQLIDQLKRDGITVLKSKNGFGRRFSLEHYTNLLVRSQSMSAYNTGAKMQLLGSGRRFAKIPTIRPDVDGDDICNDFERQVYIDLTDPTQLPPYHPNCRHVPQPVSFEELKAERPDLYAKAVGFFKNSVN